MKHFIIVVVCLLLALRVDAQKNITGTVVSSDNQQPIPYASLFVLGTNTGTTADGLGVFTLVLSTSAVDTTALYPVRVSAIGFQADTVYLKAGPAGRVTLRRDAELPTVTVSGGEFHPLQELKLEKYLPVYLTPWEDMVATCYRRSGKNLYQLRLLTAAGTELRYDLDIGKITGMTSHCSERLYVFTDGYAVSFELDGQELRPIERIPLNDYQWLFAECRDRQEGEYLYEKKRLRGMNKLYLLLSEQADEQVVREYLDTALVNEFFYGVPIMDFDWVESKRAPMWWEGNGKMRRAQAMAHFDRYIQYNNHNDNPFFFAGNEIKLVNFDEGLVETFTQDGEPVAVVPFRAEVDKRVELDQRIFRDVLSGKTFALARDAKGHRLYHFDADTGRSKLLLRLDVELVEELVVLNDQFYLLARQDRFGPESDWRIYRGDLD